MSHDFLTEFHGSVGVSKVRLSTLVEGVMGVAVVNLERATMGYVNEVYRADLAKGPPVFVRIRRRGGATFETEAWALNAARSTGVPVPEVYAVTVLEAEAPLEVMVLAAVPGQPLGEVWLALADDSRRAVLGQVGTALRALHSTEPEGWGRRGAEARWEYADGRGRAAAAVRDRETDAPVLQAAGLTAAETAALLAIVGELPTLEVPQPVLCHGDLGMDHLFVDDSLTLTGVIDFGMWQGGPRALDFAVLSMYHPDVSLAWLEETYRDVTFGEAFYRQVLIERVNTMMGFFAHDLRQGRADYAELALSGLRGTLASWRSRA